MPAFLAAGGLASLLRVLAEHTPPMRALAGYVLSQLAISRRCWAGSNKALALAAPLFQAVVESLGASITLPWEEVITLHHTSELAPLAPPAGTPASPQGAPSPNKERFDAGELAAVSTQHLTPVVGPFAAFAATPPSPPTKQERQEEATQAAAAAAVEGTQRGMRRAAQQWARQGHTLCACAEAAVVRPHENLPDCFKEFLQLAKAAAVAGLHEPQGAAAEGAAGALARLARSRQYATTLMNIGAGSTVAKLLRAPDLGVRVQAACAVVLLGWHAPTPSPHQLLPPASLARREPPAEAEARRLATLNLLAPSLFHPDAPVPLEGVHRGALVRAACTAALLGALSGATQPDLSDALTRTSVVFGEAASKSKVEAAYRVHEQQLGDVGTAALLMLAASDATTHTQDTLVGYTSIIPLAQARGPLAARHVAAAVWCLARKPEHWNHLVQAGATKRLVAAAQATVTEVLEAAKAKAARLQAERDEARRKEEEQREREEEAAERGTRRTPMRVELDLPWETKSLPATHEESVEEPAAAEVSSAGGGESSTGEREMERDGDGSESDGEEVEAPAVYPPRTPEDGAQLRLHTLEWQLAAVWLLVSDEAGVGDGRGAAPGARRGWKTIQQAVFRRGGGGGGGVRRVSTLPWVGLELMLGLLREHANPATAEVLGQSKVLELAAAVLVAVVMGPALAHAAPYLVQVRL